MKKKKITKGEFLKIFVEEKARLEREKEEKERKEKKNLK